MNELGSLKDKLAREQKNESKILRQTLRTAGRGRGIGRDPLCHIPRVYVQKEVASSIRDADGHGDLCDHDPDAYFPA